MSLAYIVIGADKEGLTKLSATVFSDQSFAIYPQKAPEGAVQLFIFPGDFREELQSLPSVLAKSGCELARIIAGVDSTQLSALPYCDMLAHFADVMLITNAHDTLKQAQKRWHDRPMSVYRWPEDARLTSEILYPEARRLTQYFDADPLDEVDEIFTDEEEPPEKINTHRRAKTNVNEANLEDLDAIPEDPYFKRDAVGAWAVKVKLPI